MSKCLWTLFKNNFNEIITNHEYFSKLFKFLLEYENNILLYGSNGFPIDLLIDELLMKKFKLNILNKKECTWNKEVIYYYNQHFIELDLMNPFMAKNLSSIPDFILEIIKNKNINASKHFFIIKNIDYIANYDDFSNFRIIFERFSSNVYFLCTTHKINKIDVPVQSRFNLFRIPNFTHNEIKEIFSKYLFHQLNKYLCQIKTRNIIKAIFISQVEIDEPSLIDEHFCTLNFPPIYEFIKKFDKKKYNVDYIRQFAYKCFQYKIEISDILSDLIKVIPKKSYFKAINTAANIDHALKLTNKAREPIYIEALLCEILL